ncbi:hypothetical protein LZS85_15750 [Aliivibrio fischeri]|uniref:hypothetical protein n=1 Tax=Aliivibrio fischeri TaxID=668 RepID=UPI001F3A87D5|nr:hypothetical protein [Aliivibrio fischeri]MCE7567578.1 hypothetical protein [Aliivibrio fischeri]
MSENVADAAETQSTDTAVNNLVRMVQNQLKNIQGLVDAQVPLIESALDGDVKSFNEIVDECEEQQELISTLKLKNETLEAKLQEEEQTHTNELYKLRGEMNHMRTKLETLSAIKDELKRLKSLDPDRLKRKNAEQRTLLDERLKSLNIYKRDASALRKEVSLLKKTNLELESIANTTAKTLDQLEEKVERQNGSVVNKEYVGKNGLSCYINIFNWPLAFRPQNKYIKVVNDFDFHLAVRTNWGISLMPSCSTWLVPFLPSSKDLEGNMPTDLHGDIQSLYYTQAEKSHPHYVKRVEWAKDEDLELVDGLSKKLITLLNNSNFFSVYSVAHIPEFELSARVKGLGTKTAIEVKELVDTHVSKWVKENWNKEQIKGEK